MKKAGDLLTIGEVATRTGLSVSAIRFYESKGLIQPNRAPSGQRRFFRSDLRRLSFILIAQKLGLKIGEIAAALDGLPDSRTPTKADWTRISTGIHAVLDARIAELTRMRENLTGCIGCGCLSLDSCRIYNPDDDVAVDGPGPRNVMIDGPDG